MGDFAFHNPNELRLPVGAQERAYMAGMEGVPWRSRNRYENGVLTVSRAVSDSGNLYIPWNVQDRGELVLSSASLMEQDAPYHLPVELARGTLNRLRNQVNSWQVAGLETTQALSDIIETAMSHFVAAATRQNTNATEADQLAQLSIETALEAIDMVADEYSQQVLKIRHQQAPKLATLIGCNTETKSFSDLETSQFLDSFNLASVPFGWREIEPNAGERDWLAIDQQIQWCRSHGVKVCGGPLLRIDERHLPDWIYLWEDDFDAMQAYFMGQIEAAVKRYSGSVHIWQCAAGLNLAGALPITEEQKLHLAVGAIETARREDRKAPLIVTFDQPWAEYLQNESLDLSPLHFADALIRADLGIAGIGLEINMGYWPHGTLLRDPLEFSQQIDRWAMLGLPLILFITIPSSSSADPNSRRSIRPHLLPDDELNDQVQDQFVKRIAPLLIAKQSVHGIIWSQRSDANAHEFPHGGLFDTKGAPKPALETLKKLRQQHLN